MVSGPYNIRDFQKKMIPEQRRSNPRHNQQLAVCGHMGMYYEGKKKRQRNRRISAFPFEFFYLQLEKIIMLFFEFVIHASI